MVQNPEMLAPIRRFKREMLDRLKANAQRSCEALTIFLALEGLRSLKLCDVDMLTDDEFAGRRSRTFGHDRRAGNTPS